MTHPLQKFSEMAGKSADEAKFFWTGGPIEVAPRTWFASVFSGVTAFETDEGLVLIDSGLEQQGQLLAALIREKTSAPVHTAIFTQGHVDHAYGLKHFLVANQAAPRVIAQRAIMARFARYAATAGHNAAINARQFGGTVDALEADPAAYDTFRTPELPPTILYDERLDLHVGGISFQIHHCRGETDDHSWIYCPERRVLCPGDLFIYAAPNAGNPQKVQRYPWDWAHGLRQMAACGAASLCPGHGGPVVGDASKIELMLHQTAEYLDALVTQTLAAMNDGSPPHTDIVERVAIPSSASPWLEPVYDEAEFIVRNVIRYYGGWWTGRPSELKPAARASLARELAALAGGAEALAARAQALVVAGELRLASHLADFALEAAPDQPAIQAAVSEVYEQRAERETSLMAVNLFKSAAAYARQGKPFA
jgi:alkyl sulfatase BDS1-like metallo-beta-lactamase superfamily hydrolase